MPDTFDTQHALQTAVSALPADKRRVPLGERKVDIKELYAMHHEIIRMLAMGHKPAAIAEHFGITPQTVSNTRNSALAKAKMRILQECRDAEHVKAATRSAQLMPKAMDLLERMLANGDFIAAVSPEAALKIIKTTAEFSGFQQAGKNGVTVNVNANGTQNNVTYAEDLAVVKAAVNTAKNEGIIDVEVEAEPLYDIDELTNLEAKGIDGGVSDDVKALLLESGYLDTVAI